MKIRKFPISLGISILALAAFAIPAHAQTTFTGGFGTDVDGNYDYANPANWSTDSLPTVSTGGTAQISDGLPVTFYGGSNPNPGGNVGYAGDYIIANGGELEVTAGSWTQALGGNWIQLEGNGNILINGGTFNQGSAGNNPFNTSGVGNTFTISSGSAAFNGGGVQVNAPLTWLQSGGNVTSAASLQVQGGSYTQSGGIASFSGAGLATNGGGSWTQSGGVVSFTGNLQLNSGAGNFLFSSGTINVGNEVDFSNLGSKSSMTGGVMNITSLFTMVNGPTGSSFNFSGGLINDLAGNGNNGWYGPGAASPFNFTVASTGTLQFLANANNTLTLGTVQGWVNSGAIAYNDTLDAAAFSVTQTGSDVDVSLLAVPEPATYALLGFGSLGMWFFVRRKKARLLS